MNSSEPSARPSASNLKADLLNSWRLCMPVGQDACLMSVIASDQPSRFAVARTTPSPIMVTPDTWVISLARAPRATPESISR